MTKEELVYCIDEYGKSVYSLCCQITGNVQEGEELYQDTFMKALEILERIDINNNPKSYLLSIAIKLWKNKRRKYAWRQRLMSVDFYRETMKDYHSEFPIEEGEPEKEVLRKELESFVRDCIEILPDKYKLPIYLYYTAELSINEIAVCLKIPVGTVKSRLHKAKELLKKELEVIRYDI